MWCTDAVVIYLPLGRMHYKAPWFINPMDDGGLQGPIKASHIDLRLVIFRAEPVQVPGEPV